MVNILKMHNIMKIVVFSHSEPFVYDTYITCDKQKLKIVIILNFMGTPSLNKLHFIH